MGFGKKKSFLKSKRKKMKMTGSLMRPMQTIHKWVPGGAYGIVL